MQKKSDNVETNMSSNLSTFVHSWGKNITLFCKFDGEHLLNYYEEMLLYFCGVSWSSGLAHKTQVLMAESPECGFESRIN